MSSARPARPLTGLFSAAVRANLIALCVLPATRLAAQQDPPAEPASPGEPRVVRVLEVGTVHPVSGPAIQNGVIVIEDGRITGIGPAGEVEVPDVAEIVRYPTAHAYPGLVDALSTAFGDAAVVNDNSSDAGTEILAGLDPHEPTSRSLISFGITTAYVSNRGSGLWRGMGALVHPRSDGFEPMGGDSAGATAVQMRISGGQQSTHPLARQKALRSVGKSFDQLEEYEKKKTEHAEALEEYAKKYDEYLEYFRKKNKKDKDGDEKAEKPGETSEKPDEEAAAEDGSRGRGGSGRRGRRRPPSEEKPPAGEEKTGEQEKEKKPEGDGNKPAEAKSGDEKAAKPEGEQEKAPEKPKYPKAPTANPALEALIGVRDGKMPLRVEARHADEIRAALHMRREHEIPQLVLEMASEAGDLAAELAEAGIPVVAANFLQLRDGENNDDAGLPGELAAAGVAVAIGSGSVREARFLPLLAAAASGHGLDPDAAIAAITLTPARILGVGSTVGSLEPGKRADILITDQPLLASDARILVVLSGGETQYEAK